MLTKEIQELEKAKAHVAELEAAIAADIQSALAALPSQYGFATAKEFTQSVQAASRGGQGGKRGRPAKSGSSSSSSAATGRRTGSGKRARITDSTRNEVKKMVKSGMTGNQIASQLGISLPSVQNIKKAFGLVKARGK